MTLALSRYVGAATAVVALATGGVLSTSAPAPDTAPAPVDGAAPTQSTPPDAASPDAAAPDAKFKFDMVRSTGSKDAGCLKGAGADVTVTELGDVEEMKVKVHDMPAETEFDLFVLQVPDFPFGVAWYQSDLTTDQSGNGTVVVKGRFNEETFALASGVADAPTPHDGEFPDAAENPAFDPVHTFHLGMWFNSPEDAVDAGCTDLTTAFNGEHTAGPQALSTRTFDPLEGPLGDIR